MTALNIATLVIAAALSVAYVCRLGLLDVRQHQTLIVLLHIAGMGTAFNAGVHACRGQTDLQDIMSLALAGLWIGVSLFNWRGRVPDHWRR